MIVHIVGGGPTGVSIAWELLNNTEHEVHLYEKKDVLGGSWHEPAGEKRDLHAPRMLFKNAFVNTRSLFSEMNMEWNDYFLKRDSSELYKYLFKNFELKDYLSLTSLVSRVFINPEKYKKQSLKDSVYNLSENGKLILSNVTYSIDGVGWDVMTAYEFVESFNQVGLSSQWEQKVSGREMGLAMQKALLEKKINLHLNTELTDLKYLPGNFEATFSNNKLVTGDLIILCIDNFPASIFVGNNWGPDAREILLYSSYTCLHVLLDYDKPVEIKNEVETSVNTRWHILASTLPDKKTVSCMMCNLNEEILTCPPEKLYKEIISQLGLPEPESARVATGNYWQNNRWKMTQSSGVASEYGQLPFFGENPKVVMCGMMSPRNTPYSSIEAAIEVGRNFCNEKIGTRKPLAPLKVSTFIILIVLILIIINEVRRRNL